MAESFGKKLIIAIITTLNLSFVASIVFYMPVLKQEYNAGDVPFLGYFLILIIMIAPAIFTVGIIFSMIVERKVKGITKTILSYLVGGVILGILYYLIYSLRLGLDILVEEIIQFTIYGGIASLCFLSVQSVIEPLFTIK